MEMKLTAGGVDVGSVERRGHKVHYSGVLDRELGCIVREMGDQVGGTARSTPAAERLGHVRALPEVVTRPDGDRSRSWSRGGAERPRPVVSSSSRFRRRLVPVILTGGVLRPLGIDV